MKNKRILPLLTSFFLGAVSLASCGLENVSIAETVKKQGTFIADSEIKDKYSVNSEISVPSGKISYKGQNYSFDDYYLKYPDGKTYKKETFNLDMAGRYEFTFIHKDSSDIYATLPFLAYNGAYGMNSEASYANYTEAIPTNYEATPGISVTLAESDMFTYNQVVDISESSLAKPLIVYHPHAHSIRANPENEGIDMSAGTVYEYDDPNKPTQLGADARCSVVRVTDAYDPSIYFETLIYFRTANMNNNRQQQYCVAGASGQDRVGIEEASTQGTGSRVVKIDGVSYREYIGYSSTSFGVTLNTRSGSLYERRLYPDGSYRNACVGTTLDKDTTADISNADDYGYSIYYDYASKKVYIKHITNHMVNDLDEPVLHGSNLFPGFTTGEVYISVYGLEYSGELATFDIESIYGIDDLSVNEAVDHNAPIIELDNDNDYFNIAVNEPFKVFGANIIDYNYHGDLSIRAYYEYGEAQQSQINIVDGLFTPTKPGKYTVIYEAKDSYGNSATKEVNLYAIVTATDKIIDFSVNEINEAEAGQKINLPAPDITVYNNSPIINCYAEFEDGSITNINTSSWELFLEKVGNYQIRYEYSDGISEYSYSYTLKSVASDKVYLQKLSLPKYIIKNASFTIDEAKVVKVKSKQLEYDDPTIYISEDGGSFSKAIDRRSVKVEASDTVQFQYRYGDTVVYTSESIPVVDVNFGSKLDKSSYFYGDNIGIEATSSTMVLSPEAEQASATFINPLNLSSLVLGLDLAASKLNECVLDIVLTDFTDENNKYVISLYAADSGNLIYVRYDGKYEFGVNKSSYNISYSQDKERLMDSFDNLISLVNPFSTDRYYLSFNFRDVTGSAYIAIKSIDAQTMNRSAGDNRSPNIVPPNIDGRHPYGKTVDLDFFYPEDVLSPYYEKNYSLTVTHYVDEDDDNIEYVISTDGAKLDGTQSISEARSFLMDKVGTYEIFYSYSDQVGNGSGSSGMKMLYCVDDLPPTLTIDGGFDENTLVFAELGSTYTVNGYKATDDLDGNNVSVSIFIFSPSLKYTKLDGRSFNLSERGDYRVYYYASDSSGNISSAYYTVRVD